MGGRATTFVKIHEQVNDKGTTALFIEELSDSGLEGEIWGNNGIATPSPLATLFVLMQVYATHPSISLSEHHRPPELCHRP